VRQARGEGLVYVPFGELFRGKLKTVKRGPLEQILLLRIRVLPTQTAACALLEQKKKKSRSPVEKQKNCSHAAAYIAKERRSQARKTKVRGQKNEFTRNESNGKRKKNGTLKIGEIGTEADTVSLLYICSGRGERTLIARRKASAEKRKF